MEYGNERRRNPPCGNADCSTSTGIDDYLTFGSGDLDDYGFWEHPCAICEDVARLKAIALNDTKMLQFSRPQEKK